MLVAISLFLLVAFLVGYPLAGLAAKRAGLTLQDAGNTVGAGLLLFYLAGLVAPSLRGLVEFGWLFAVPGALLAARAWRRPRLRGQDVVGAVLAAVLLAALADKTLSAPVTDWDARSIWYFHAKAVHFAGHALDAGVWHDPALGFSHPDYPKLNAVLAALWTARFAGWNEVLPKASLVFLLAPAVLLCLGFTRALPVRLLIAAVLVLKAGNFLWNGTMDGILAAYAGLAVLYGGRYAAARDPRDLLAVVVAAAFCAGLKNEGVVLAAVALGTTLAWSRRLTWRAAAAAGILFAPCVVWWIWRTRAGVVSELISGDLAARVAARAGDGESLGLIARRLLRPKEVRGAAWVTVAALGLFARARTRWVVLAPAQTAALTYGLALGAVYLTTPYDLPWHLQTSAGRTALPLFAFWLAGAVGLAADAAPPPAEAR